MGTPPAKLLLHDVSPWMMAGLLYAGAGTGLWAYRRLIRAPAVRLRRREALWLTGAVLAGGLCGHSPGSCCVGANGHERLRSVTAAERRRRVYCAAGLVHFRAEF